MGLNLKEFLCEPNLSYYQGATNQIESFKSLILTYLKKLDGFQEEYIEFKFKDLASLSLGPFTGSGDGFIPQVEAYIPTVFYKNQEVNFIYLLSKFDYEFPKDKIYIGAIWSGYFDDDLDLYAQYLNYKNLEDFNNDNLGISVVEEYLNVKSKNILDKNIIVKFLVCSE